VIKNIPPPPPSPTAAATLSLEQEARNVAAAVDVRFADKADNELVRERIVRIALRAPRDIQIGTFDDEFRQYWKTRWSDKYPRARLEDLIVEPSIKTVLNDPLYVFRSKRLRYIGPLDECRWTCWRAGDTGHVELGEYLHTSDWPYPTEAGASLVAEAVLYKESLAVGIYAPVIVFVSRDGVNLTNKDSGLIIENLTMYLEYKYVERYRALMSDVEWDFFYRVVGLRDVAMKDCCFTQ